MTVISTDDPPLTSDPSDGGQFLLQQQVVGLIVEAPLADGEGGARGLHLGEK